VKNVEDVYPLSPLQEGLFFTALAMPGTGVGFEQSSWPIEAELDVPAFRRTWERAMARHPILRTAFLAQGLKQPLQVVRQQVDLPFENLDWRGLEPAAQRRRLEELLADDRRQGFDLGRAPLLRVTLVRLAERRYHLVWSHHHLLLDGWSRLLLLREVLALYAAFAQGGQDEPPRTAPFRGYIAWLQKQDMAAAERHWRHLLAGFRRPTPLPLAGAAGGDPAAERVYSHVEVRLSAESSAALRAFAREPELTLNTLVQGAWALLLGRYAGTADVVFGSVFSGRPPELPGSETMLGMFINNLPVRVRTAPESPLVPWLRELQAGLVESRRYELAPLARVQDWSEVPGGQRLFGTLVVFQSYSSGGAAGDRLSSLGIGPERVRFETGYPLALEVEPDDRLLLRLHHEAGALTGTAAGRLLAHLTALLEAMPARSEGLLRDLRPPVPEELAGSGAGEPATLSLAERIGEGLGLSPDDVLLSLPGAPADRALDLLLASARGARVVLAGWGTGHDGGALATELEVRGASALQAPPGVWVELLRAGWQGSTGFKAIVAGEPPSRALADALRARTAAVWTVCGPDELAGVCLAGPVSEGDGPVPAGYPAPGTRLRILDGHGDPVPVGVAGRLCAGEEQAETGLRARVLDDGGVELLGVSEAGDVEAELRRMPGLLQAAVEAGEDPAGGARRLTAHFVAEAGRPDFVAEVRRRLLRRLPGHLVPADLRLRPSLPLLPSGRVDRAALAAAGEGEPGAAIRGPANPLELQLLRIWEEAFGIRPLAVTDGFFALGGHSLLALRLAAEIGARLGVEVSPTALIEAPTIAALAALLAGRSPEAAAASPVPLHPEGDLAPVFWIHPAGGNVLCYVPVAGRLGPGRPSYGFEAPGVRSDRPPLREVEALAVEYLRNLRRMRPEGPVVLAGWSFGGLVALEMAQRLRAEGREVPLLAILDTWAGERRGSAEPQDSAELIANVMGAGLTVDVEEVRRQGDAGRQIDFVIGLARSRGALPAGFDAAVAHRLFAVHRAAEAAAGSYRPRPYAGRVALFRATERVGGEAARLAAADPTLGWGRLAAELRVYEVAGRHEDLCAPPQAAVVGEQLRACLAQIEIEVRESAGGAEIVEAALAVEGR
jgi:thioesterase domain-containing protein